MVDEKKCFIIMPISTPENMISEYRDGEVHFKHVLDCLILPAIKKAGFEGIPPKAKGADLIHAEIVNNLEISDLVLCDISTLNANVFFEFGIRTSLNKPVCIVKDDLTKEVPFDTGIINYSEYDSSLESWKIEKEIETLSKHIIDSYDRSNGSNDMWKYFGFKFEAVPAKGELSQETQYRYLSNKIENIAMKMDELFDVNKSLSFSDYERLRPEREKSKFGISEKSQLNISKALINFEYSGVKVLNIDYTADGGILLFLNKEPAKEAISRFESMAKFIEPKIKGLHYVSISPTRDEKKKQKE